MTLVFGEIQLVPRQGFRDSVLWPRRLFDVSSHLSRNRRFTISSAEALYRSSVAFDLTFHSCCESTKQGYDTSTLRPLVARSFVKRCYIC